MTTATPIDYTQYVIPASWDIPTDLREGEGGKVCGRCRKEKRTSPISTRSAFARHYRKGYQDWCKDCYALTEWIKSRPGASSEQIMEYMRRRVHDRENGVTRLPPWIKNRQNEERAAMNNAPTDTAVPTEADVDGPTVVIEDIELDVNDVNEPVGMYDRKKYMTFDQWAESGNAKTTIFNVQPKIGSILVHMDQNGLFHILTDGLMETMFGPGVPVTQQVADRWLKLLIRTTVNDQVLGTIFE